MRYIILGDIHGCYFEMEELLEKLSIQNDDKVISIGDIIHKGPDESRCLHHMAMTTDFYILGNHEEKQLRWEKHNLRFKESGKANPMQHVEGYNHISSTLQNYLRDKARLFHQFEAGGKRFLLVHGGIEPRLRSLPKIEGAYKISRKEKSFSWNVLRTRYVNPEGRMVSLGAETERDVYWADVYDGRFGHVIFGHQPFLNRDTPKEYSNATAIDLGCVYGGYLCALVIDSKTGATHSVAVKAHKQYQKHRTED